MQEDYLQVHCEEVQQPESEIFWGNKSLLFEYGQNTRCNDKQMERKNKWQTKGTNNQVTNQSKCNEQSKNWTIEQSKNWTIELSNK